MFFPKDTLVIGQVKNGFVLKWKGTREEQEDNLDGIFVFPDVGAMCTWLKDTFPDDPKEETKLGSSADIIKENLDKMVWKSMCPYPHLICAVRE